MVCSSFQEMKEAVVAMARSREIQVVNAENGFDAPASNGWADLTEVAWILSHALPSRISIQFRAGDSSSVLAATLADLTQAMATATAFDMESLPPREEWLAQRRKRLSNVLIKVLEGGAVAPPHVDGPAGIPLEVPALPAEDLVPERPASLLLALSLFVSSLDAS